MKKISLKIFDGDAFQCDTECCPDCGEEFTTVFFGENVCGHCGRILLACERCPALCAGDLTAMQDQFIQNAVKVVPSCSDKHCPFAGEGKVLDHLRAIVGKGQGTPGNTLMLGTPWKRGIHTLVVNGVAYAIGTSKTVYGFTYEDATIKVNAL